MVQVTPLMEKMKAKKRSAALLFYDEATDFFGQVVLIEQNQREPYVLARMINTFLNACKKNLSKEDYARFEEALEIAKGSIAESVYGGKFTVGHDPLKK